MLARALAVAVIALAAEPRARADATAREAEATLALELVAVGDALLDARLQRDAAKRPPPARSVDELDALLAEAYDDSRRGRGAQAVARLVEAVEGPRFRDFEGLPAFAAAELMLASLLIEERALGRAERLIARLTARGPGTRAFAPAFQRGVDVALLRGDLEASADRLEALLPASPPREASDALHYLRGLAAHDDGLFAQARAQLAAVGPRSRFHTSARYLLGVVASAEGAHDEALAHFRAVCAGAGELRGRLASPPLDALSDLARLGLGRLAHEQHADEAAFAHYFRVPSDSPHLPDALFEAAWASYAQGNFELARDALDQRDARFAGAPRAGEARLLRGYVALAQRRFEEAARILAEVERVLAAQLADLSAVPLPRAPRRDRLAAMARALADARRASPRTDAALAARADALARALAEAHAAAERDAREALGAHLAGVLRRAQIGRVDAIMGEKRALEDEIASLAAGRFPAELAGTRSATGLLRDDEEYWPFEGERWDDERVEPPTRGTR